MKKQKLCFVLAAFLATTLAMAMSGFAANGGSTQALMNGQNFETMTACQGGVLPVTMVSGQTNLQISATVPADTQCLTQAITAKQIHPDTINSAGINSSIIDNAQAASSHGSYVQLVIAQTDIAGPGGDNFHAGKILAAKGSFASDRGMMNQSSIAG